MPSQSEPGPFMPSEAARAASDYFNALPFEERKKLAPLLDHYRQMGVAEANNHMRLVVQKNAKRIREIRQGFND